MEHRKKFGLTGMMETLLGLIGLSVILLTTLSVLCRFVLKVSIVWSDEVLRTIFVWSYFIGSAMLYRSGGLMRLELLDDELRRRGKRGAWRLVCILQELGMLVFSGIVTCYAFFMIRTQVVSGQVTTTSGVPAWILTLGFAIGMCLLTFHALRKMTDLVLNVSQGE